MEDTKRQNRRGRLKSGISEFGAVRVLSNPAPDADDRLRRLFTLLLEHTAGERQDTCETNSSTKTLPAEDDMEGEV